MALEKFHCTRRELLRRVSAEDLAELQAHFLLEAEDAKKRRAKRGKGERRSGAPIGGG